MSLNPVQSGSKNAIITQNSEISQDVTAAAPRRRVALNILKNVQKVEVSALKLDNSVTIESSNGLHKPIEQVAQEQGITPSASNEKANELKQAFVQDKLSEGAAKPEVRLSVEEENAPPQQNLKNLGSSQKTVLRAAVNRSHEQKQASYYDWSKIAIRANSAELDSKHLSKAPVAKSTYQASADGTRLENVENIKPNEHDVSRWVYLEGKTLVVQEGIKIAHNAQVVSKDGTTKDLEFNRVFIVSKNDFRIFISPVIDKLNENNTPVVEKEIPVKKEFKIELHQKKHEKDILSSDPIMKKLKEAKDESDYQEKTQGYKNVSIKKEKLKIQEEKSFRNKLKKTDETNQELILDKQRSKTLT